MIKKVSILGTVYTVHLNVPVQRDKGLERNFGYCFPKARKIVIADLDSIDSWKSEAEDNKQRMLREIKRHEVIHAFLFESGLWGSSNGVDCWALNEEMIDWFAIQWPKIRKVFTLLECDEVE